MYQDRETMEFIKEREQRLGRRIIFRTYSLYYGSSRGEERQWGVFLYSDGETFIFEDFDRPPTFLGIEIKSAKREKYVKLERSFLKNEVEAIAQVTRSSAEAVVKGRARQARPSSLLDRLFRKNLTEVRLKNGETIYFELMEKENFSRLFTL